MHILYLHQYFTSRQGATGTRSYEFSRYLTGKGHRVTILTSGVGNTQVPVPTGRAFVEGEVDGIRVVAVDAGYNDPKIGTGLNGRQRMMKFYEFARAAGRVGKGLTRPDVVFATSTPLPIGLAGITLSRHFKVPFVFEVRDLWPEGLVDLGLLKNPLAIWWLGRLAKKIYRAADHIVALAPGMKEGIVRAGQPAEKVTVIPNASDLDLFRPDVDGSSWRDRLGLAGRFAAIYFGAMGHANGLEYVVEAARILTQHSRSDIVIVLLGEGGRRAALEELTTGYQLHNVVFHDPVPREEAAKVVAACQACMTILRPSKHNAWSPNKLFDAMAAGKPVLINVPGWLGGMVEENQCGKCLDARQPHELADALEELADKPTLCQAMGRNSRSLAEREFDRVRLAARLENILQNVVRGRVS